MKIYKTKKGYFYKEYKSSVFKGLRYNGLYKKSKQFLQKMILSKFIIVKL